jgi:hypothetical protein
MIASPKAVDDKQSSVFEMIFFLLSCDKSRLDHGLFSILESNFPSVAKCRGVAVNEMDLLDAKIVRYHCDVLRVKLN